MDKSMKDPFAYFYVMPKIHKPGPMGSKTRGVSSDCGSLPHTLGQWVDETLQPIAQSQSLYFPNSIALKEEYEKLSLTSSHSLFTYDAIEMYPNIPTDECCERLERWFKLPNQLKWFKKLKVGTLMAAIKLVMKGNRMKFGDLFYKQILGVAMGMSPAPPIANLFVGIFEEENVVGKFAHCIASLRRFIDDGIGVWLHDPDPEIDIANWIKFKTTMNSCGLKWTFSPRSQSAVFMDMTISIENGKIETVLYSKPLALYLYIPPHSCHAPGVLTGLICGMVLRIHQLCTKEKDVDREIYLFMRRVLDRGHNLDEIKTIFSHAITNAKRYIRRSPARRKELLLEKAQAAKRQVYFHLPYHPNHPSSDIKKAWKRLIYNPPGKLQLNYTTNQTGHSIPVDRFILCFHRSPNLGNKLSYRKIDNRSGPKVSSFLD